MEIRDWNRRWRVGVEGNQIGCRLAAQLLCTAHMHMQMHTQMHTHVHTHMHMHMHMHMHLHLHLHMHMHSACTMQSSKHTCTHAHICACTYAHAHPHPHPHPHPHVRVHRRYASEWSHASDDSPGWRVVGGPLATRLSGVAPRSPQRHPGHLRGGGGDCGVCGRSRARHSREEAHDAAE
jgi:hypothetical protein